MRTTGRHNPSQSRQPEALVCGPGEGKYWAQLRGCLLQRSSLFSKSSAPSTGLLQHLLCTSILFCPPLEFFWVSGQVIVARVFGAETFWKQRNWWLARLNDWSKVTQCWARAQIYWFPTGSLYTIPLWEVEMSSLASIPSIFLFNTFPYLLHHPWARTVFCIWYVLS